MGRKSRDKGAAFECLVKNLILAAFPDAKVFRTLQADRAHQSDVHVADGPGLLSLLWIECHHGPTSIAAKLAQARRDANAAGRANAIPVVIWRRTGAREVHATMALDAVLQLRRVFHLKAGWKVLPVDDDLVTMSAQAFLRLAGVAVADLQVA